jgi:hypothetical protein
MLRWRFSVLGIAAIAVFSLGSLTDRALAQEKQGDVGSERDGQGDVTLRIQGDKGARFSGACSLGEEQREISGRAPRSFEFDLKGRGLSCEIGNQGSQSDELEVVLSGENIHSVQRLGGAQGTLKTTYDGDGSFSSMSSSSQTTVSNDGGSFSLSKPEEKALKNLGDRIEQRVDDILKRVLP